jgi:nicotinate-nucleotide--dimethylbenzimidazole phosphoribosyltransferase
VKKFIILFTILSLLLLVGCNKADNNDLVSPTTDPVNVVVTTTEDPNQWELPIDSDIVLDTTAPEETTEESTEDVIDVATTEGVTTENVTTGHQTEASESEATDPTTEPEVTTPVVTTEAPTEAQPTEPEPTEPDTTVPATTKSSGAIELPMIPG